MVPYFEPGLVLETIERERITATMVVPTMLYMLMDHPDFATRDLSSLETVYYGAAAMSPTRLAEAIDKLGPIFFQYYGQAEAPMTVCVLRKDGTSRPGRSGWPRAGARCRGCTSRCWTTPATRCRRARPARSACGARW